MFHLRGTLTVTVLFWCFGLGLWCLPAAGRDVKLVLHPQKAATEVGKFSLLPPESTLIDEDAVPLYEKAIKALPDKAGDDQIDTWLKMPHDQLPLDQVEQALTERMDSLRAAAKAVKCRQCNWPGSQDGVGMSSLSEYRRLARVVQLWARLEIADQGYEGAILALQTGFGMARQMGQTSRVLQSMVAIAVGTSMCREVEEFVQGQGAPNLYPALASLPRPFVDMEKTLESDRKATLAEWKDKLSTEQIEEELKKTRDSVQGTARSFNSQLAALQCVEAIRSYAATHGGQLPKTLAEITEASVPTDPQNEGPFQYSLTGSTAVLESAPPAGASDNKRIRYEISIKN